MDTKSFKQIKKFMCIGAHCDDIEMRCGGTFARLVRQGAEGAYVNLVDGPWVHSRGIAKDIRKTAETIQYREQEAHQGAKVIGASRIDFLRLYASYFYKETINPDDRRLRYPTFTSYEQSVNELQDKVFTGQPPALFAMHDESFMKRLETLIREWEPEVIFTQNIADNHPDHYATARIVTTVLEKSGLQHDIKAFSWYPGGRGNNRQYWPTHFVELSEGDVEIWEEAFKCFKSQFEEGILSTIIRDMAETFGEFCNVPYAQPFNQMVFQDEYQYSDVKTFMRNEYRFGSDPEVITL